jgi:hypothetical protein
LWTVARFNETHHQAMDTHLRSHIASPVLGLLV